MARRSKKPSNVVKHGRYYYLNVIVDGKRKRQSLQTEDKQEAMRRARPLVDAARAGRWDELDGKRVQNVYATIGDVINAFQAAARIAGEPKHETARNYASALRNVVRKVKGDVDVDALSTAELTRDLVKDYGAVVIKAAGGDNILRRRARTTIRSTLRQARALFSTWAKHEYQDCALQLPDLDGFLHARVARKQTRGVRGKHQAPPHELREKTMAAGEGLPATDPKKVVWILCYRLAMRVGEAVRARPDWIVERNGRRYMDVVVRTESEPKAFERSIPMSQSDWDELQPFMKHASGFLIPGDTHTQRENAVKHDFARWMRELGWDRKHYRGCAQELRALRGSEWFSSPRLGPAVAQKWLGHASIQTTCQFYADLLIDPAPLDGAGPDDGVPVDRPHLRLAAAVNE